MTLDEEYAILKKLKEQCNLGYFGTEWDDAILLILSLKDFLRAPHKELFEQLVKIKKLKEEKQNTFVGEK